MGKDGRKYVVVAAGGPGDARRAAPRENFLYHETLVAFALPRPGDKPVDIVGPYPRYRLKPGESMAMDGSGGASLVAAPSKPQRPAARTAISLRHQQARQGRRRPQHDVGIESRLVDV